MKRVSRSVSRRYSTRAPTSEVDETLFGGQTHEEMETVQIITKDLIRNLRIRSKDPSGESMRLPPIRCEQITSAPRLLTKEEREAQRKACQRKTEEERKAAAERTHQLCGIDLACKNKLLTKLELEARERAQRLAERVKAFQMEEQEEIKKLNQRILAVQCQATWEAQVQEKKQIQAKLSEEEKRLDAMMEVERCRVLKTMNQIAELHKDQRVRARQQVSNQIQEHQEVKQALEETKRQERQQIQRTQEKMNVENLKALEKKREEQQRLQEECMRINAETVRAKEQRRQEEKLADTRVLKAQQETNIKQEEEEEKRRQRVQRHTEALRNQIKQRELSATAKRREVMKEADVLTEEARQRRARLDEIMERKLRELRAAGLPEIYCSKVERKACTLRKDALCNLNT